MKTTGVSDIPKFGLLDFLGHPNGNITPEKARKSQQMQFRDKTAYVWGLRYWSFAIDEPRLSARALYATLP